MRTLAIVGTLVYDRVVDRAGGQRTGFGGIAYAVGAAAGLARGRVQIRPVCRMGTCWPGELLRRWASLPRIDLGGLVAWEGPPTRVELEYGSGGVGGDRRERLLAPMPPLSESEVRGARGCDAVLVNCVSGFDLTAAALEALAEGSSLVLLDVHSLTLGRRADGLRFGRRLLDLERWLRPVDVIQCNRAELSLMTGCTAVRQGLSVLRRAGCTATVLVTAGAAGAVVASESRTPLQISAPATEVVDPTGAGDVFGAAWSVARLLGAGPAKAARIAVQAASASCRVQGAEDLDQLAWPVTAD